MKRKRDTTPQGVRRMHNHTVLSAPTPEGARARAEHVYTLRKLWDKFRGNAWFTAVDNIVPQYLAFHEQLAIHGNVENLHTMIYTATSPWRALTQSCVDLFGQPLTPLTWTDGPRVPRQLVRTTPACLRVPSDSVMQFVPLASSLCVETFLRADEAAPYNGIALALVGFVQRFGGKVASLDVLECIFVQRDVRAVHFFLTAVGSGLKTVGMLRMRNAVLICTEPLVARAVFLSLMENRVNDAKRLLSAALERPDAAEFIGRMGPFSPLTLTPDVFVGALDFYAAALANWKTARPAPRMYKPAMFARMHAAFQTLLNAINGRDTNPLAMLRAAAADSTQQLFLLTELLPGRTALEQMRMLETVFQNDLLERLGHTDDTLDVACRRWLTFARHAVGLKLRPSLENYVRFPGEEVSAQDWLQHADAGSADLTLVKDLETLRKKAREQRVVYR